MDEEAGYGDGGRDYQIERTRTFKRRVVMDPSEQGNMQLMLK